MDFNYRRSEPYLLLLEHEMRQEQKEQRQTKSENTKMQTRREKTVLVSNFELNSVDGSATSVYPEKGRINSVPSEEKIVSTPRSSEPTTSPFSTVSAGAATNATCNSVLSDRTKARISRIRERKFSTPNFKNNISDPLTSTFSLIPVVKQPSLRRCQSFQTTIYSRIENSKKKDRAPSLIENYNDEKHHYKSTRSRTAFYREKKNIFDFFDRPSTFEKWIYHIPL